MVNVSKGIGRADVEKNAQTWSSFILLSGILLTVLVKPPPYGVHRLSETTGLDTNRKS